MRLLRTLSLRGCAWLPKGRSPCARLRGPFQVFWSWFNALSGAPCLPADSPHPQAAPAAGRVLGLRGLLRTLQCCERVVGALVRSRCSLDPESGHWAWCRTAAWQVASWGASGCPGRTQAGVGPLRQKPSSMASSPAPVSPCTPVSCWSVPWHLLANCPAHHFQQPCAFSITIIIILIAAAAAALFF